MAENSKIEWTDHTFNPWIGCSKVHEGCANCYAEELMDKRYGKAKWGLGGTRTLTSDANWAQPLKWNRAAEKAGQRARVFCASLADVFEHWTGPIHVSGSERAVLIRSTSGTMVGVSDDSDKWVNLDDVRRKLFDLIDATPWLDWLLLTKRPENIRRMWACPNDTNGDGDCHLCARGRGHYRDNVWLGTSVSLQAHADRQIPELLNCRNLAPVLFLSIEPLLGPLDVLLNGIPVADVFNWAIVGGESGPRARPMHPQWVRDLRDQCEAAGVPFFFKQWGEWAPSAGRLLDGREYSEFPEVIHA